MLHVRKIKVYQHVSGIVRGRNVVYCDCGLSYRSITSRVDRDPRPVCRIWNRPVQQGKMCRSQQSPFTNSREDIFPGRLLIDCTATSPVPSQKMDPFERQLVSAPTVLRSLEQNELSTRSLCLRLPLTLHHRHYPDSNFNLQQTCSKPCIASLQTCSKFRMTSLQVHNNIAAS